MIESIPTWQALLMALAGFAVGCMVTHHWREIKLWRMQSRWELASKEYWRQRVCLETVPLAEFAKIDTEPLEWLIAEESYQRFVAGKYRKKLDEYEEAAAKRAGGDV